MHTTQPEALPALIERFRNLHIDHAPDGWPAVRTREITALMDRISELEALLDAVGAGGVGPLIASAGFDAADMATAAAQGFRDGATATAQPVAEPADTVVLNAAMRAIQQAIELIGAPTDERMRAVRRVLRGAVIVAEDAGKVAPRPDMAYAAASGFRDGVASIAVQAADSVLEDAARYRLVRRGQYWSVVDGIGNDLRAEALDAAVDEARKQGCES